jgi:hypothetical protein
MSRIISRLKDAIKPASHFESAVHFHADGGRPFVCHDEECSRPHLPLA